MPDTQKRLLNIEIFSDRVELRVPSNYKVVIITTVGENREEEQKECKCCMQIEESEKFEFGSYESEWKADRIENKCICKRDDLGLCGSGEGEVEEDMKGYVEKEVAGYMEKDVEGELEKEMTGKMEKEAEGELEKVVEEDVEEGLGGDKEGGVVEEVEGEVFETCKACEESEFGEKTGEVREMFQTCPEVIESSGSALGGVEGPSIIGSETQENRTDADGLWFSHFPDIYAPLSVAARLPVFCPVSNNAVCHLDGSATRTFVAEGGFGSVFMGRLSETGERVAVKEFTNEKSSLDAILREATVLQRLHRTGFVPRCFGVTKTACGVAIVQEFFGDGLTLHSLLYDGTHSLSRSTWAGICFQLAYAMKRVHEEGFTLNDLKLDNVLVDCHHPGCQVRLIDMGHTWDAPIQLACPPERWALSPHYAPEVLNHGFTSLASDVFSLGYLFWLIHRKVGIDELWPLVQQCVHPMPEQRPPIDYVIALIEETILKMN